MFKLIKRVLKQLVKGKKRGCQLSEAELEQVWEYVKRRLTDGSLKGAEIKAEDFMLIEN